MKSMKVVVTLVHYGQKNLTAQIINGCLTGDHNLVSE